MASANKDNTIEYDKQMYKKTGKSQNHLAGRVNKFQEKLNQIQAPTPPVQSIHAHYEPEPQMMNAIKHVHQLIKDHGTQGDYAIQIQFGELISIFGENQVEQLVNILAAARKSGYINYIGADLLQRDRDEEIFVRLIKTPY